jgi:hypothetical protein
LYDVTIDEPERSTLIAADTNETSANIKISGTSAGVKINVSDTEKKSGTTSPKKTIDHDFAERMRKKFKREIEGSSDEEDDERDKPAAVNIVPRPEPKSIDRTSEQEYLDDPAINKITEFTFECKICSIELNKNCVKSHLSGKQHVRNTNRSRSQDRRSSINGNDGVESALEGVRKESRLSKNGASYIETRNSSNEFYFCNLCKVEISKFNTNLLQHVTGSLHKRLACAAAN